MEVDKKWLGLVMEDFHNRDKQRSLTTGGSPTLPQCGNDCVVLDELRSREVIRYY